MAFQRGTAEQLPVKLPKKGRRQEDMTVFILSCDGRYAIEKRGNTGLLADLWQFPNVPGKLETQAAVDWVRSMDTEPAQVILCLEKKHIFTHVQWNMRGYYLEVRNAGGCLHWLTPDEIDEKAALPTAFRQFWEAKP